MLRLKFPAGISVPTHKDLTPYKRHFRLNFTFKDKADFKCEKVIFKFWRLVLFRPDLYEHSLDKSEKGIIMLSLGIAF